MLLVLSDEHKEHLSFLTDVDTAVVREFCRISLEFIRKGSNPRMYQAAGQKLGVAAETVRHGVEGLMYLLTECSKLMVTEIDFLDSIMTLGFGEDRNRELLELYQEHCAEIRAILSSMAMDLPQYHDMEWRAEVQLASRSLLHRVEPSITLRIHTKDGDTSSSCLLQADPVNLLHLTKTLEGALSELNNQHCRRIMRSIK